MNEIESIVSTDEAIKDNLDHDPHRSARVVVLLNKALAPGVALNAIAHLGMAIANVIGDEGRTQLKFLDFSDADGGIHPSISARSLIVLRGKSSELRKLRREARTAGLATVDFTNSMTGGTYRDQLERTFAAKDDDLEYFGVAVFGPTEMTTPLTRRHSLWT
jgi:hypothetical protein